MAKRKGGPSTSGPRSTSKAKHDARENESIQWLDKLSHELWDKVLDNVEENDLFPLALSCRYFRQKQKELVARTRQSGPGSGKPRLALMTNLYRKFEDDQPASADYLRFWSKENVPYFIKTESQIECLASFHGYLPLLQELLESSKGRDIFLITGYAGQYFSSQCLLLGFGF